MKKNIIIFISGLIIGLFIMYSINYSAEKQQTDIVSASIDELKLVETVVKRKNAYDTLDPELSSSKSNLSISSIPKKIIPTNSNNRIEGTIEKVKSKGENELQDVLYSIVGSIPIIIQNAGFRVQAGCQSKAQLEANGYSLSKSYNAALASCLSSRRARG